MKFHRILFYVCLTVSTPASTFLSPNNPATYPQQCPMGRIVPASDDCCGSEYAFEGAVSGWFSTSDPVVTWTVSSGKITSGQGTWAIKVDVSETCKKPITVTMKVTADDLPKVCEIKEEYTTKPCP